MAATYSDSVLFIDGAWYAVRLPDVIQQSSTTHQLSFFLFTLVESIQQIFLWNIIL